MVAVTLQYRSSAHRSGLGALRGKEKSFVAFGFGAGGTVERPGRPNPRETAQVEVNVNPGSAGATVENEAPEIRKYKKKFSSEVGPHSVRFELGPKGRRLRSSARRCGASIC